MTPLAPALRRLSFVIGLLLAGAPQIAAQAQQPLVIGNDRGGLVGEKAAEIEQIKRIGRRVEIRGAICYSSCTMYLGAADVCISPQTTFGFHGPSKGGTPLPADQFERWSRLMASYYNAPLQQWFLQQGRYVITDIYRMSGAQLIRLGYQTC
ncbi:hypothetical protein [Loktanella salsilacus]|uniref:hypothetical protein n=1 Tax=Loktanella salsilacus TaxID=195913 RepID=UPI0037367BA4